MVINDYYRIKLFHIAKFYVAIKTHHGWMSNTLQGS